MYAVAEGAAIVAAGLVEKSLTVSRNYCIELADDPRFTLIKKGAELPAKESHIFKIEADGQRLIHFKFFSPDEVRNELDNISVDERIGQMWLALDKHYPKGTEVTVLSEIDEQNEAVQMTAHLRNDESVRVSCSFGRGGQDAAIAKKVEELINQLNDEGGLSSGDVEAVYKLAGDVVQSSNSMIKNDGTILKDRERDATEKLNRLEMYCSDDHAFSYYFIERFGFILEKCKSLIADEQEIRINNLRKELIEARNSNNISRMQKLVEDAKRENENLPDLVNLILLCRAGINRALQINPTAANAMTDKFARMLYALEHNDMQEVQDLLRQLLPDVEKYLDHEIATGTVATGLTK
jgi:molecular chaperone DnaK